MKRELFGLKRLMVMISVVLFVIPSSIFAMDYAHEIKLKRISFAWKVEGDKLYVKLTAATKGWVGIGFNPTNRMQNADFVLGYVKNGKVEVTDAFGVRPKEHINDTLMGGKNNITAVNGSEEGKTTTIEFAIPVNSGDKTDTEIDLTGMTNVLLAFGGSQDNFHSRHRFRTSVKVNLSTGETQ